MKLMGEQAQKNLSEAREDAKVLAKKISEKPFARKLTAKWEGFKKRTSSPPRIFYQEEEVEESEEKKANPDNPYL